MVFGEAGRGKKIWAGARFLGGVRQTDRSGKGPTTGQNKQEKKIVSWPLPGSNW